jgi:outer membrane protein insertion porin family
VVRSTLSGFLVALLGLAPVYVLAAAPEDFEGKRIAEIFFEPRDQPLTRDQLGLALQIRPNDTYERRRISQGIERLFATGRFASIEEDVTLGPDGVIVTFRTTPAYFIARVSIDGVAEPPNQPQLSGAAKLEFGGLYDEALLPEAASQITSLLRANGFYSASVRWETARRTATEEVDIRFIVDSGPRALFTTPVFQGRLDRTPQQLIKTTRWLRWWGLRGWRQLTENRLDNGIDRLRASYLDRDFLQARIALDKLQFDRAANTVSPHLAIDAGPRTFVRTDGGKVSRGALRSLIPIYQERTVDRELLVEGERNLTEYFQARGYFDAKVSFVQEAPDDKGAQTIVYQIDRGSRSRLVSLAITGNRYFKTDTIRERMDTLPASFLRYRHGRFSRPMLNNDLESVADLYRANGFRDVKVTSQVAPPPGGKAGDLEVTISIDEGPQWLVSAIEVSGVDLRIYEEVTGLLTSTPGQPFSTTKLLEDRDAVLGYYFNSGYPDAGFDYTVTLDSKPFRMKVSYNVLEGRRNFVRDVLVTGIGRTHPNIVNRRISVKPGDPLSQAQIVDSQRRIYDLGIFSKVDVAVQNPEGRERNKYVLFQLDEARRYSTNFGLGAEITRIGGTTNSYGAPAGNPGFSPRVSLGITRLNVFNVGHTVGIQTRFSRIQNRALLNYFAPQFRGDERFNLTLSALADISRDVSTFTSRRVEGAAQLAQRLSRSDTLQYRFVYRLVNVSNLKIDPLLVPFLSQPVRVGVLSGTWIRDRRDDPLDSHRGMFSSVDFGVASKYFGSKTDYARSIGRNTGYYRVGRDMVLARMVSLGALYNFQGILNPIPLPERFFGGGASTHRGFPENQAGPRDPITGYPLGGSAFLFFSEELRFPLVGRNLGAVVFHDAGNVYSRFSRISFNVFQKNPEDFDYMVHAVGFGIRYRTPIGPVRFDTAYAFNPTKFYGCTSTNAGACLPITLQSLGSFQFHFSLGQTY